VENDEIDWQQYDKSHFLNPEIMEKLDRILTLDIAEKLKNNKGKLLLKSVK
jgi:non-homologous end joining protein Ku